MTFADLFDGPPRVAKVAGGFVNTEGPVFSRRGYLLFSDAGAGRIHKWERGQVSVFREKAQAIGLTFDHQGRLLACEERRVTRTEKDGRLTVLASRGLTAPNDLVYSIDGSIYFTDLHPGASRVYQITRRGEVRVASEECDGPNGVALSPNQQNLYVAELRGRRIRVFDLAPDGALRNGRVFAEAGAPLDGIKTDEAGNVWVADGPGVIVFDAAGRRLGLLEVPESPSNLNWGEGFRGLYITARTSVYHVRTRSVGTRTY